MIGIGKDNIDELIQDTEKALNLLEQLLNLKHTGNILNNNHVGLVRNSILHIQDKMKTYFEFIKNNKKTGWLMNNDD